MELNKHILLVMKWLNDKDSASEEELVENKKSAAAYSPAADLAAEAAYLAAAAAAAADLAADLAAAEYWVNKYFERTGENKQDYIDAIEAGNKAEEPESKEWDGEGLPPINSEVLLSYNEGYLYNAATNEPINIAADEVLIVISIGARYDNGNPVVTVMAKDNKNLQGFVTVTPESLYPVKTQEQKDREAFIERCVQLTELDGVLAVEGFGIAYDDGARFKAPEGE